MVAADSEIDWFNVSTHSRPKAAEPATTCMRTVIPFQHTAARRRLKGGLWFEFIEEVFQHTAARRRLTAG